ncbi:MAG: hypothetical protein JSR83_00690 [Proteobacteria bacterium]|nr:hypothetical protein [Pseudomonadota bacterium]
MGSVHATTKRWNGVERRTGGERRQHEGKSPTGIERRKHVEPRQMEVVELFLSPEQWQVARRRWFPSNTTHATQRGHSGHIDEADTSLPPRQPQKPLFSKNTL